MGVTTRHSEDSMHWMRHAPYWGPKPNRSQGNPGLLHSHTELCYHGESIILLGPRGILWGLYPGFRITNPWLPHPASPRNPQLLGLWWADHYLGARQSCSGRWLLPRVRDLVWHTFVHLLFHGAVQYQQPTFVTLEKCSPYDDIAHLCDAAWILTR